MTDRKVNLGCGLTTPSEWINVDGSWNARLVRWPAVRRLLASAGVISAETAAIPWGRVLYHDLRKPLPWPADTVSVVYASHLLEHLYKDHAVRLLEDCKRVLVPGGVLRLMVPDIEVLAEQYLDARRQERSPGAAGPSGLTAADTFIAETRLRSPSAPDGPLPLRLYRLLMDFETHKWMYDASSLTRLMRESGFRDVAVAERHVSRVVDIASVETNAGLIVEGIRP